MFVRLRQGKKREKTVHLCDKGKAKDRVQCAYLEKEGNGLEFLCREQS